MRIAAGILLIIAALFNGCAGSLYAAGGAATGGAASGLEYVGKKAGTAAGASQAEMNKFAGDAGKVKAAGSGFMIFGLFLFAMLGLQIAGAVVLFMQKAKTFVLVVGGLGLLAEIIGISLTSFGPSNIAGLLGSGLAIAAASQYANTPGAAAGPAAAA